MPIRDTKGISAEQCKSDNSARETHTPTSLCDAAYLRGGEADRNGMNATPDISWEARYKHRDRLRRLQVDQGHFTLDKAAGDFESY